MLSRYRMKKLIDKVKDINTTTGLTDGQVEWVKDKMDVIENWKLTAVQKFADVEARIEAIEIKADKFQTALVNLAARVKALEDRLE
jgi:hypothetical protein